MNSSELLSPTDAVTTPPRTRSGVRRRLVQSTLFPHKSPEVEPNVVECVGEERDEDNDGEDEERGGSQGKKKGTKRKSGKGTPQKRASKKGKGKSPVNATPNKNVTPKKNATPNKNAIGNGKNLNDLMEEERGTPPAMPNLMLEAKLANEENSRIFNGKQMYSIFLSCKSRKRTQGMGEEGINCCSIGKKDGGIGPIHVFERIQDDVTALDWRGWRFSEGFSIDTSCSPGLTFTSILESSAKALTLNNFSSITHQLDASFMQKKEISQSISQDEFCSRSVVSSCSRVDEPVASCQLSEEHRGDETAFASVEDMNLQKVEPEQTSRSLDERLMHHSDGWSDLSRNSLWTEKYQPKRAMEVSGNIESVKFMSEWLRLWHDRDSQPIKDSSISNEGQYLDEDDDYGGCESDSDDDDDENRLKNVLLVTGPIGCGKSAAIYACAKEQGFEILESNTSEYRTGVLVKQKFGEALESHCVARSLENPDYRSMTMMKSSASLPNSIATKKVDIEVIDISEQEDSDNVMDISGDLTCNEIKAWPGQVKVKSLILFEDVDISFPEERGLVAAIQRISETAKRPVILTTNSTVPVLPDNFDRLELYFTMPSPENLLPSLKKVCAEEKAQVQPYVIEQLIRCCKGDIRKAIMHLQFWCNTKDLKMRKTSLQLPFDIEAAHHVLPNVMPWGFPSKLSALIEEEITKSLAKRTEDFTLLEAIKEEGLDDGETFSFGMHNHIKDSIVAKKKEMLSRNFSLEDCNEILSPADSVYEVSDSLGTPVSCSLPERRRKLLIASSDSEDEHVDRASCLALGKVIDKDLLADNDSIREAEKFEPTSLFSEVATQIFMDACKSVDISEVPESSFVPETILEDGIEMSSKMVSDGIGEIFVNHNLGNSQTGDETDYFCKSSDQLVNGLDIFGSSSDIFEESSHEDVGTSQTENSNAVSVGHYVMDECSCMDFARRSDYNKKLIYHVATDIVQESWKKLRDTTDLKHYARSEPRYAFHILRCSHQVCDLLSEVDLMLSKSQMRISSEAEDATFGNSYGYCWCDEQLHMSNIIGQHGFCLCAKNTAAVGSIMDSENQIDWAEQMLLSSSNTMALGGLLGLTECASGFSLNKCSGLRLPKNEVPAESKSKSSVFDLMKSILPSRSYSTLTSHACHEYLSSLRCISRAEASRLSSGTNNTGRRRGRIARHYLSTGSLMLSAEDISFLDQGELSAKIAS